MGFFSRKPSQYEKKEREGCPVVKKAFPLEEERQFFRRSEFTKERQDGNRVGGAQDRPEKESGEKRYVISNPSRPDFQESAYGNSGNHGRCYREQADRLNIPDNFLVRHRVSNLQKEEWQKSVQKHFRIQLQLSGKIRIRSEQREYQHDSGRYQQYLIHDFRFFR